MKKISILITIIGITCAMNIQKVKAAPANTAFDDDAFYKCVVYSYVLATQGVQEEIDYNQNLSDDQLQNIDFLTCNYSENTPITSLKGLEKLTNLTRIWLERKNKISTIDLSHVPNLTSLRLTSDSLNTIDLSYTPKLTNLALNDGDLSTIDLSHTPQLKSLDLNGTTLGTINLDNLINLTSLYLDYTKLSTIDLSHLSNLTYLSLDGSNKKLQELSIRSPKMNTLDLRENQDLEKLDLTPGVTCTYAGSCGNIKKIYFSKTKIKYIDFDGNMITSIDINTSLSSAHFDGSTLFTDFPLHKSDNYYYIDLKEIDPDIDLSKVYFEEMGERHYDKNTGIITFTDKDINDYPIIQYDYLVSSNWDARLNSTKFSVSFLIDSSEANLKDVDSNKKGTMGTQLVKVADTLMNNKILILVVSIILIIIGSLICYFQIRKNKNL